MKTTFWLAAATATLAILPAKAGDMPPPQERVCLRVGEINDFKAPDNKTLIITDNLHKKFKVTLLASCSGLTFRQTIGVDSPGSTRLSCMSAGDTIVTHDSGFGHLRCAVKSVEAYTPEMEKADKDAKEKAKAEKSGG